MNVVNAEAEESSLVIEGQEGAAYLTVYLGISLVLVILPTILAVSSFFGLSLSLSLLREVTSRLSL